MVETFRQETLTPDEVVNAVLAFDFKGVIDVQPIVQSFDIEFLAACVEALRSAFSRISNEDSAYGTLTVFERKLSDRLMELVLKPLYDLTNKAESIDPKLPLRERLLIANELREELNVLVSSGEIYVGPYDKRRQMIPADFSNMRNPQVSFVSKYFSTGIGADIKKILGAIKATETECQMLDYIGTVDKVELGKNRLKFGAKGANLLVVRDLLQKLCGSDFAPQFQYTKIPDFTLLDVELYKKWKAGEDIKPELKAIYDSYEGMALIVRSSAVYSEDGEQMTGAGVYESVKLESGASFEDFANAVVAVYESCDSEEAINYRKENGVETELMGVVIQERIEDADLGYVNSTKPSTVDLTYLKCLYGHGSTLILRSKDLDKALFGGSSLDYQKVLIDAAYIPPDLTILMADYVTGFGGDILLLCRVLEKYYGQAVQVEFAIKNECAREEGDYELTLHFLQCRPLPVKMFNRAVVEFPNDKPHIYESQSEGVCDEELEVLSPLGSNNEKTGLVCFNASALGSMQRGAILNAFPKNGAVMILVASNMNEGHIETLALEKGITLLFNERGSTPESVSQNKRMRALLAANDNLKLRVVSDGRTARIYEV